MIEIRQKKYRSQYNGESIVVERVYKGGIWHDTTEVIPNSVINNQISNQAVILGNGPSRLDFDLKLISNHRGGLLGSKRLQSYGCNALYRDFAPDFLVATGDNMVTELSRTNYPKDNIVYVNSMQALEHPGLFYIVPYNPYADAGTTAAYIACFDGHKKLYMLGFDWQDTPNFNYNVYAGTTNYDPVHSAQLDYRWKSNFAQLASVYDDVDFAFVYKYNTKTLPEELRKLVNVRVISHREFVLEADI